MPHGFSEPTATIIWSTPLRLGMAADHFVLWNAFPWHSFDARRGMLSNRTPTNAELAAARPRWKLSSSFSRERRWRAFSPADRVAFVGPSITCKRTIDTAPDDPACCQPK
jgi:hypothetical protein